MATLDEVFREVSSKKLTFEFINEKQKQKKSN